MTFLRTDDTNNSCWIKCGFTIVCATITECECTTYKSTFLPCRHIFATRKYFKLPFFHHTLCPPRWTADYNIQHQPALQSLAKMRSSLPLSSVRHSDVLPEGRTIYIPSPKLKTFNSRLKFMKGLAGNIAYFGSVVTGERYEHKCDQLQTIENSWRQNCEVDVHVSKTAIQQVDNRTGTEHELDDKENNNIVLPAPVKISGRPKDITECTINTRKKKPLK